MARDERACLWPHTYVYITRKERLQIIAHGASQPPFIKYVTPPEHCSLRPIRIRRPAVCVNETH